MSHLESAGGPSGSRRFWKVAVTVWADEKHVSELVGDIRLLLCPDPDHQPPCPIPWELAWHQMDDADPEAESLRGQVTNDYPEHS